MPRSCKCSLHREVRYFQSILNNVARTLFKNIKQGKIIPSFLLKNRRKDFIRCLSEIIAFHLMIAIERKILGSNVSIWKWSVTTLIIHKVYGNYRLFNMMPLIPATTWIILRLYGSYRLSKMVKCNLEILVV